MHPAQPIVFPPFRLDPVNEQLWRENQLVLLPPKTFAVLRYLVEHAGRLVTKEELTRAVWAGTRVSEGILKGYIRDLREVLGDRSAAPRFIETVPRRGHRFIAPVTTTPPVASSQLSVVSTDKVGVKSPQLATGNWQLTTPPVGREAELTHLHSWFERALSGTRQLVFVTGEPGIGKTTVVDAFLQQISTQGGPWVGQGQCVEHYGAGEAYLPVLEALGRVGRAPGGERLIALLNQHAPTWLVQMPALLGAAELEALQRKVAGVTRERMLREAVEALAVISTEWPLVLCLEDLHWADHSTVDWLAAVAQRREPARLLVIGTYRPADISLSGHPLRAVKRELLAKGQCEELWLQFLTSEEIGQYLALRYPQNQFPPELGEVIHRSTDGNPLFIVNTIDYLMAQDAIVEGEGRWRLQIAVEEISRRVPESLRQLIEKHIERLSEEHRRLLEVASVVGGEFSAAVVGEGLETTREQVEDWCEELVKHGQFLRGLGPGVLPDETIAGRYGFLHALYQTVLYERLPPIRRIRLHRRIGESEERLYGNRTGEMAAELVVHFERGQDPQRAVTYLQQAAQRALQRSANHEVIRHLTKALELLRSLPDTPERAQQELRLQITLGASLMTTKGYAAPEVGNTYARARELSRQVGESPQLFSVLVGLWTFYFTQAECRTARELGEQLLSLAQSSQNPARLQWAHYLLGYTLFSVGELIAARAHLEKGITLYDPQTHRSRAWDDPGVNCLAIAARALWVLGYPTQALRRSHQVLTLARELSHPAAQTSALDVAARLHQCRREVQAAQEQAEALIALATEWGLLHRVAWGTLYQGWALAERGQRKEGIARIRQGIEAIQATGAGLGRPYCLGLLAEVYGKVGQTEQGLSALSEALQLVKKTGEHYYEAELYRLKGTLMLQSQVSLRQVIASQGKSQVNIPQSAFRNPKLEEAEAYFQKAIEIARRQQAKSLELRAVMSLSRLWQSHGKRDKARKMLAEIYGWFTEGFDTADLQEAKVLLAELTGEGKAP